MNAIGDKAAIVGIGQTPFSRSLGRSEFDMAVEAILAACDDAGISPREIDGVVRYDMETTDEEQLLAVLGNPELRYQASTSWGGGGSVACSCTRRSRSPPAWPTRCSSSARARAARRRSSARTRCRAAGTGSGWPTGSPGLNQWHVPHGLVSAFQEMAMITRRHMIDYGTTEDQFADVAIALREHARAQSRTPSCASR